MQQLLNKSNHKALIFQEVSKALKEKVLESRRIMKFFMPGFLLKKLRGVPHINIESEGEGCISFS